MRWGMILCKFSDQPQEPFTIGSARDLMAGSGSLREYWTAMSFGKLDTTIAFADGWNTLAFTLASFGPLSRADRIAQCFADYMNRPHPDGIPPFDRVIVFINSVLDSGNAGGNVLIDPQALRPTFIAHEMGHALGLDHSFDTRPTPWDAGSDVRPGAYGNSCDIMSAEAFGGLPSTFVGPFGAAGPGLNALTRERLQWLPLTKVSTITHNPGETFSTQVSVGALDNPAAPAPSLVKITSGGSAHGAPLAAMTYLIEFRPKTGWDAGTAADAIVIHMLREGDVARIAWSSADDQAWRPASRFVDLARGIALSVVSVAPDKSRADVLISAGANARLPLMSVRKTLAHKVDLTKGLRAITPRAPFRRESVRDRLLDNPPQLAP
jgi:hypothetical protein